MSGAGFFRGTTSPARTVNNGDHSGPATVSRIARAAGSADVDATARRHPASAASPMIRRHAGSRRKPPDADHLREDLRFPRVPPCDERQLGIRLRWQPLVNDRVDEEGAHPLLAAGDGQQLAVLRRRPFHPRPISRNVWLNAGRWASRSVSARTPSQSKMSAFTLPVQPNRGAGGAHAPCP